jgi:GT2 family glycosyltransferase
MQSAAAASSSRATSNRKPERPAGQHARRSARQVADYAVGIVNYRTYGDLERCLESLNEQAWAPAATLVVDVDSIADRLDSIRKRFPTAVCEPHRNGGFAAGANIVLDRVRALAPEAEFVLLLNPDVELAPDFAAHLTSEMVGRPNVAVASGKLLRPGRSLIDSAGIRLPAHRRPRDRGSEELDCGQYDEPQFVFGVSGAALMIRRSALQALAIDGEVFDEDFFMYHEDTDLCWRANLLGWDVLYAPQAEAVHGRRWRRDGRFEIGAHTRRHSFKNHYLEMIKNERPRDFLLNLPAIALWEVLRLGFALLHDRSVLTGYRDAWRLSGRAWRKRAVLQDRVRRGAGRATPRPISEVRSATPRDIASEVGWD